MFGGNVAGVILNRNLANWEYPKRRIDERDQSFAAEAASVSMAYQHDPDFARSSAVVDALNAAQADRATGRSFYDLAKQVPQRPLRVAA